jgi:hypothetical protein
VLPPKSLAEEVSRLPCGPPWILRDVISNQEIDLHELDGGIEVERLVHIVRGRVGARGVPFIEEFLGIEVGRLPAIHFFPLLCWRPPARRWPCGSASGSSTETRGIG